MNDFSPADLLSPYSGFLIDKLNKIYEAWDEGDVELALRRAIRLALFLPKDLKDKIADDVKTITKDMDGVDRLQGSDFYTTQLRRNKRGVEIASRHLAPFVDMLTDLLDARGYLEKPKRRVRRGKFGD